MLFKKHTQLEIKLMEGQLPKNVLPPDNLRPFNLGFYAISSPIPVTLLLKNCKKAKIWEILQTIYCIFEGYLLCFEREWDAV